MVVRRKSKLYKRRGRQRTYGWGSSKKHRGKGSKGGKGMSGIRGKRGQHRTAMALKMGIMVRGAEKGFKRTYATRLEAMRAINLKDIELRMGQWLEEKIAAKKDKAIEIDLAKAGYDKVLGAGTVSRPVTIKAKAFSSGAKEKIEKAGGRAEVVG